MKTALKGLAGIILNFAIGLTAAFLNWLIIGTFIVIAWAVVYPGLLISMAKKESQFGPLLFMVMMFGMIAVGIIPIFLTQFSGFGRTRENLSVNEVNQYPLSTVFYFNDAVVFDSCVGFAAYVGGSMSSHARVVGDCWVAPLIAKDWKESQEIQAFITAETEEELFANAGDCMTGVRQKPDETIGLAIQDALTYYNLKAGKQFNLKAVPNPAILVWGCNSPAKYKTRMRNLLIYLGVISGIWLLFAAYDGLKSGN